MNGTDGIGTGYSTQLPCYSVEDITNKIMSKLLGKTQNNEEELVPFYRGFKGTITKDSNNNTTYVSHGCYYTSNKDTLVITELPVGKGALSFKQYKEFILTKMTDYEDDTKKSKKNSGYLLDEESFVTDKTFKMTLKFKKDTLASMMENKEEFEKELKLSNSISISNIHLYDENGFIKKYQGPNEILDNFYVTRLTKYSERKQHLLNELNKELVFYRSKAQFIKDIINGVIELFEINGSKRKYKSKQEIESQLKENNYPVIEDENQKENYNYLLHMRIESFTEETIKKLEKQVLDNIEKIDTLTKTHVTQLWLNDINEFKKEYSHYIENWNINYNQKK